MGDFESDRSFSHGEPQSFVDRGEPGRERDLDDGAAYGREPPMLSLFARNHHQKAPLRSGRRAEASDLGRDCRSERIRSMAIMRLRSRNSGRAVSGELSLARVGYMVPGS